MFRKNRTRIPCNTQNRWGSPFIWVGFACTIAWPWCLNSVFPQSAPTAQGSLVFLVFGITGLAIALGARHGHALSNRAVLLWGSLLYLAASLWYALSLLAPSISREFYGPGVQTLIALSGGGQALFFVRWIGALSTMEPRATIVSVAASAILGAAILLTVGFLPSFICAFVPLSLGLGGTVCFARALTLAPPRVALQPPEHSPSGIPWKLITTAFLPGLAFGLQQNLYGHGYYGELAWVVFGAGGFAVAAVISLVCALTLRMNFNRMIYQCSYVVMALGCVLGTLWGPAGEAGYGIFAVGYRLFDILLWSLGAFLIYTHELEPDWFAGICVGSSLLGRFAGFSPLPTLLGALEMSHVALTLSLLCFALLTAALFLENSNNTFEAWGLKRPDDGALEKGDIRRACTRLSHAWGLTSREQEILELAARGVSRRDLANELCISEQTVKTHLSKIFQKSGCHARGELEARVRSTVAETRTEPPAQSRNQPADAPQTS